jgi:hypothetical protein
MPKPDMSVEKRQTRLQKNGQALDYWIGRMLRAANQVDKLRKERKRLLGPKQPREIKYRSLDDIRMAAAGDEFNDDIVP